MHGRIDPYAIVNGRACSTWEFSNYREQLQKKINMEGAYITIFDVTDVGIRDERDLSLMSFLSIFSTKFVKNCSKFRNRARTEQSALKPKNRLKATLHYGNVADF